MNDNGQKVCTLWLGYAISDISAYLLLSSRIPPEHPMSHYPSPYVDIAFPLRGAQVPIDHGYALYAALSRILPALHENPRWSVHPIVGEYQGRGILALTRHSRLTLRAPTEDIGHILHLTHQSIHLDGHTCQLGVPRVWPLRTVPHLRARLVIIKPTDVSIDAPEFDPIQAVRQQLERVPELGQLPSTIEVQPGPRRVLRIKQRPVPGFALALTGLEAQASLAIQCHGLGGRRHMGAGVFVPPRRAA